MYKDAREGEIEVLSIDPYRTKVDLKDGSAQYSLGAYYLYM